MPMLISYFSTASNYMGFTSLLSLVVTVASAAAASRGVLVLERLFPVAERAELEFLQARDRARHARMLTQQRSTFPGGIVDFRVVGTSDPFLLGLYFTKVRLGSPPREFNLQIDTGSDILWVACSSCTDCPQNSGLGIPLSFFDPSASFTASRIPCSDNICSSIVQTSSAECLAENNNNNNDQCGYSFQYGDGSGTSGSYISDLIHFDSILGTSLAVNSSARVVFGCGTSLLGTLMKPDRAVDGIIGFGQQDLAIISQLSKNTITPKVFSHCLKGEGNGGGKLVLGEILDPRIVYTPLVPPQSHYNVHLQSVSVNGQLLPVDEQLFKTSGTIIDSGTTLAYLVEGAYDSFVSAITGAVSPYVRPVVTGGTQCYVVSISTSVAEVFPRVAFNFDGNASMVLRPIDYLVQTGYVNGDPLWCMAFNKVQNQGPTILGDLVLKDKIFVYDLVQRRIGWADYDCSLSVNVSLTSARDDFVDDAAAELSSSSSSSSTSFLSNSGALLLIISLMLLTDCCFFVT